MNVPVQDTDSAHATGVAGNICNTHGLYFAASFTLPQIFDAPGTGDAVAPGIWSTGIAAGIDFGNCSWWNFLKGKIEMLDRFFDYTIRNFSVIRRYPLTHVLHRPGDLVAPDSPDDLTATVRLGYWKGSVYIAVEMRDDDIVLEPVGDAYSGRYR